MAASLRLDVISPSRSQDGPGAARASRDAPSGDPLSPFVASLHDRVGSTLRVKVVRGATRALHARLADAALVAAVPPLADDVVARFVRPFHQNPLGCTSFFTRPATRSREAGCATKRGSTRSKVRCSRPRGVCAQPAYASRSSAHAASRCFGLRQEYLDTYGDRGLVPFAAASND